MCSKTTATHVWKTEIYMYKKCIVLYSNWYFLLEQKLQFNYCLIVINGDNINVLFHVTYLNNCYQNSNSL